MSGRGASSRLAMWLIVLALALTGSRAGAAVIAAEEPGLASRTFTVSHRSVDDVVALIQPALSERGSYAVQPRIRAVTVTDAPDRLQRIQGMIAGFDLPPRAIQLVIQLMRAEEGPAPQGGSAGGAQGGRPRRMGLPPSVIQDLTKWGIITQIGNAALPTAENQSGTVGLGESPEDYRITFRMGTVTPGMGVIRMDRFVLERLRPAAGGEAAPRYVTLMDLVLNLKDRQTTVLGATSSQDSKQALFISVTATAERRQE